MRLNLRSLEHVSTYVCVGFEGSKIWDRNDEIVEGTHAAVHLFSFCLRLLKHGLVVHIAPLMFMLTSAVIPFDSIQMMDAYARYPTMQHPSRDEMDAVFQLCRTDQWQAVLRYVEQNPLIAVTPMIMDNHISTTVIHQAITSKGDTALRAQVITKILEETPQAAGIKNGYGSLPLHVIAQRNTKMNAQTKERLIFQLVQADKGALVEEGGVGKRTPLHIIFTGTYSK